MRRNSFEKGLHWLETAPYIQCISSTQARRDCGVVIYSDGSSEDGGHMPQLLVNLEDVADCEQAIRILRKQLGRECDGPGPGGRGSRGSGRGRPGRHDGEGAVGGAGEGKADVASLPLPQKLKRIPSRGMWKHLVKIAESADKPLSLPELDELLELPQNKMRSLKAIMAKLENRFDVKFLKVDPDGGVDASDNPRYIMPPNVRRQIKRLLES
jgi:hypothetical protein